ncbi:hypothetical protein [Thermococcus prieurii]
MWSKLENGDFLFWFAVAIVMILAVIAGMMWGIQYVGPLATLGTVIILAFQAWCNKQTAEIMREQAGIMRQSMRLLLKKEHTEQLQHKIITHICHVFSDLTLDIQNGTSKLTHRGDEIFIRDLGSLQEDDSWEFFFMAFVTSVGAVSDLYMLYDLVEYHLPPQFISHFKSLILAVVNGDKVEFDKHLNNIREILHVRELFIIFPEDCPFIGGALDTEEFLQVSERVNQLKKLIEIKRGKFVP